SLLVFNQTRVIQARLNIYKESGAAIEILLLEPVSPSSAVIFAMRANKEVHWQCMIGNKKRWKENENIQWNNILFSWIDREKNIISIKWNDNRVFAELLAEIGNMPIPPYLNREAIEKDKKVYQTVYAQNDGSVAAPTAGLHFTENVLKKLEQKNIKKEFITLHIGAGTFKPVSTDNALNHEMHAERMFFTQQNILHLIQHKGPIIPVGTTSMRSLESLYWFGAGLLQNRLSTFNIPQYFPYKVECSISLHDALQAIIQYMEKNQLESTEGVTSIYIVPGYTFKVCKGIITNFHQPRSTLLLLISALIGNNWKKVYEEALLNNYRFLSYGDSQDELLLYRFTDCNVNSPGFLRRTTCPINH
ncbi:MAG: S-adenosylmethionine:tRNA ribosyltransferase-isomerase, partial [Bacteroidia bacterium]